MATFQANTPVTNCTSVMAAIVTLVRKVSVNLPRRGVKSHISAGIMSQFCLRQCFQADSL